MLVFRLFGGLSVALGVALIWFARSSHGNSRLSKKYEMWVALLATGLIGLGFPLLAFGGPSFESPGGTQ
jgi:drug/metabolite transporter (DMT)-like permease